MPRSRQRDIDRCAQDGRYFYAMNDDPTIPIEEKWDGVTIRIEHPDKTNPNDATLTFSYEGHHLVQEDRDFEAAQGWLTVSAASFAVTWNENASSAYTQLFTAKQDGTIVENTSLISLAEKTFKHDVVSVCKNPGINTTAIKWVDKDHLLIAINAWASGFCYSNFTEGFLLDVAANRVSRKLTEQELLDLPAVCTWNLVPLSKH